MVRRAVGRLLFNPVAAAAVVVVVVVVVVDGDGDCRVVSVVVLLFADVATEVLLLLL